MGARLKYKSNGASRSAVFRENSKWWTKISHIRLTLLSRVKKVIQQFYWFITFCGFTTEDKVVKQRWLRRKIAPKCLF